MQQCAAAQYALIRGYGFLRAWCGRTSPTEESGAWGRGCCLHHLALGPAARAGKTIDAVVTVVADCGAVGHSDGVKDEGSEGLMVELLHHDESRASSCVILGQCLAGADPAFGGAGHA